MVSWGLLDQIVASGANFVFIVIAARSLSPAGFGSAALGFEVYLLTVFAARGVAGDTLTAAFSGMSRSELREPTRSAAGAALCVGAIVGLGAAGAALFTGTPLRGVLLVVAVVLPVLVLQDFVRQALFVQGRAKAACMNDLLWAVLQLPMMWLANSLDSAAYAVFAGWALSGAVAAVVGFAQLGLLPGRGVRAWLRDQRSLWPYFMGDNLLLATSSFVVVIVISAFTGLVGFAAFRAAMTVYAPLSTIGRGVISVAVALLARRRTEPAWIRRSALAISWTLAPAAFVWGLFVSVLPYGVGEAAFGESWEGAQPLIFIASFPCAVGLFSVGASCGMRALGAGRHGFGARAAVSIIGLVGAGVGGYLGGVRGSFIGFGCLAPLQIVVWWWLLNDATRRAERALEAQAQAEAQANDST